MNRPGLKQLLHPFSDADFLEAHWPQKEPLVLHRDPRELAELTGLPALQSPADVIGACSGASITAMMPDRKDETNSVDVTPEIATKLFEAGMNMSVGSAEKFFPTLNDWVQNLIKDLGLPRTTWGRSIVYVSPPHTGAPMHFDMNTNFSLQIKGKKTWTIAPNEHVTFPTERHVMQLEPTATLLAQSHRGSFPKEAPKDARVIELTPGSLLFVPRGHWHATTSDEETIALNFTFSQQSWAVLFALTLVERLHQREAWRKTPVYGATHSPDESGQAEEARKLREARALLDDAQRQLEEMDPLELIRTVSIYTHVYRRKEGVALRVRDAGSPADAPEIMLDIDGKGTMPIDAPAEYVPLFAHIFRDGPSAWFRVEDLASANEGRVPQTDIFILLQRLAEAEVLESRDEG